MKKPTDRELFEGEIATYWLDEGILVSLSRDTRRTVENIKANTQLVRRITNNKPVPVLIYLSNSPVPGKGVRKYSTEQFPEIYSAMAMVSKQGLSNFITNLLFAFQKPAIPMKSFTDEKEAKNWLKQYV